MVNTALHSNVNVISKWIKPIYIIENETILCKIILCQVGINLILIVSGFPSDLHET